MTKLQKRIGIGLLVAIALLVGFVYTQPTTVSAERSVFISTPIGVAFEQVNNLERLAQWTPWLKEYPKASIGNKSAGKGAFLRWNTKNNTSAANSLTITNSQKNSAVETALTFESGAEGNEKWIFSEINDGTKVIWKYEGKLSTSFFQRLSSFGEENRLKKAFEQGLQDLRKAAETSRASRDQAVRNFGGDVGDVKVDLVDFPTTQYIGVRRKIKFREMEGLFAEYIQSIPPNCAYNKVRLAGYPTGIYYDWDQANNQVDVAVAFPVDKARDLDENMKAITVPAAKAVRVRYQGPMNGISKAHLALQEYMANNGLQQMAPTIEEYTTDPEKEPDPNKAVTVVYAFYQ